MAEWSSPISNTLGMLSDPSASYLAARYLTQAVQLDLLGPLEEDDSIWSTYLTVVGANPSIVEWPNVGMCMKTIFTSLRQKGLLGEIMSRISDPNIAMSLIRCVQIGFLLVLDLSDNINYVNPERREISQMSSANSFLPQKLNFGRILVTNFAKTSSPSPKFRTRSLIEA